MSSQVDEALDRLRAYLDDAYPLNSAGHSALATVRQRLAKQDTELERLRRHPDAWSQGAFDQQKQRAEAAEAEVRRLTALKDEVVELSAKLERGLLNASAEIVRLTEGLRDAATIIEKMANGASRQEVEPEFSRFRALLDGQPGEAES